MVVEVEEQFLGQIIEM